MKKISISRWLTLFVLFAFLFNACSTSTQVQLPLKLLRLKPMLQLKLSPLNLQQQIPTHQLQRLRPQPLRLPQQPKVRRSVL